MKSETKDILSDISKKIRKGLDVGCILLCILLIISMAGCGTEKDKVEATINTGGNTYSVKNLDFCKVSEKETCRLVSIDSAYNTLAVRVIIFNPSLVANTGFREIALLYDMDGTLRSQIDVCDAIGSEKVFVDQAIDVSGNLAVMARAQGEDNVIHNYLYSFDSAGKLAGDPIELTFGDSILRTNFVIGTDGNIFFGENNMLSGMSAGHQIDVLTSKGDILFVVSESRVAGNLYQ